MDRRTALKNLALVIGGTLLLPACERHEGGASIALKKINLDAHDEALIGDVAETIIPKTSTPGAKDLQLHLFVIKMLDDCFRKKDQESYEAGLKAFREYVQKNYHKSFTQLSQQQREQVLARLEDASLPKSDLTNFFSTTKWLTTYGYTNSQFYMTKEVVYELVPGRYNGYFPVKDLKKAPKYA